MGYPLLTVAAGTTACQPLRLAETAEYRRKRYVRAATRRLRTVARHALSSSRGGMSQADSLIDPSGVTLPDANVSWSTLLARSRQALSPLDPHARLRSGLAVFAACAAIYQPPTSRPPRNSRPVRAEKQRDFGGCYSLFVTQNSHRKCHTDESRIGGFKGAPWAALISE